MTTLLSTSYGIRAVVGSSSDAVSSPPPPSPPPPMPLMPPAPSPPPAYASNFNLTLQGTSSSKAYVDNPDPTYQTLKLCDVDSLGTGDENDPEILNVAFYQHKVAVSGDVMVIGSAWERVAEQCDGGAAHVYARTPVSADSATNAQTTYAWTHVQKITSRDVFNNQGSSGNEFLTRNFGHAVAVDGDTMVVSHYIGRYVNVYTRSDPNDLTSLWTLRAKLEVPSLTMPETNKNHWTEGFGYAVAVDGDTVVVSQPGTNAEGDDHVTRRKYRGAVHVFTRDVPNDLTSTWRYVSRLSTDAFDDFAFVGQQTLFGQTVAIDGDVIVVGTDNLEGETPESDIGKTTTQYPSECTGVHVFVRQSPGDLASKFKWIQVVDSQWGWTDGDMRCEPEFGKSGLTIRDGVLVVGSRAEWIQQRINRDGCGGEQGAAYVFERIDPNAIDSNWTLVQKITPPYVGCNQRGSFGWNAAMSDGAQTLVISEPRASWEWDYPSLTEYDASRKHLSAGAVHVYTRGQDSAAPNASWFSLKATIGQGGLDAPTRVGWTDADATNAMFGAGVAIHEDTLAVTCVKHFTAVYALDGVPTPWIVPEKEPGPWINTLFRDAGTTMASLVVLMGLGPSAAFAVAAIFFKPALRNWLIKHGMKKLADKIVPDLADDFRLMQIEMEEMKNFMAEQAFPRLKLGVDVHPEIAAEDIVLEPLPEFAAASSGGAPEKKNGGASFGTVQVAVVRGEKCDVNTVLPGAGAVGVPDDVAKTIKKEINLISTFNHPNLVKVKGACAEKGQIVMEHCDGGTVGDALLAKTGDDENGMSPWQRAKIASQTAAAAAYLHRQGMAHGDLNADRVQLTNDGDAKLGEYGMKETKKKVNKLTAAAFMIGAGLARVAATTLEIAEAVMESYDPEAARGNRNRRGKASRKGRTKTARTKIAPGPVCESIDDASSDGGGSSSDDDDAFNAEDEPARAMTAAMTAPELLRRNGGGFGGDPKPTPASDVYSLGMTLWQMYEGRGRAPFGDAGPHEVRARVLAGERPGFENADLKFELKGLIECCLKANPRERPSAATVAVTMKKIGETESKRVKTGDGVVKHEKKFRM